MAKSKRPEFESANLSIHQIKAAQPKLKRRINELKEIDVKALRVDDLAIAALESRLDTFLTDTFGVNTIEYNRYRSVRHLYSGSLFTHRRLSEREYQDGISDGIKEAIAKLESINLDFQEKLEDAGEDSSARAIRAYEGLELQPEIEKAAGQLFHNGHYSNAVEDAVKALTEIVRAKSGVNDDGDSLMRKVFSVNNPILKINQLADESDKSEQRGCMELFSGAVAAFRNPRAHKIIEDEPERALEIIAFVSLLAKLVDESRK